MSPSTKTSPHPIVLVGCGAVAQLFYLPTLRTLESRGEVVVHALVDPSHSARQALANAFPRAKLLDDLSNCDAPADSLVIIATPPRFHAQQTIDAFRHGWHVLCEKPMASTSAECEQMIAASHETKRLLAVGLYKRFFPSSALLKNLISMRQLGALTSFSISEGGPFKWPAASPSFFNKTQTPGGVLLDIGVHVLDLLLWWLGDPASFSYEDDAMGGLETNVLLQLEFAGGARGRLHLSRDWSTPNQYQFAFERGTAVWNVNDANGLTVHLSGAPSALQARLVNAPAALPYVPILEPTNPQSFIAQVQNVCGAIAGRNPLLISGEEGIRSLKLIEDCYRNKKLIQQPWLSPREQEKARQLATTK